MTTKARRAAEDRFQALFTATFRPLLGYALRRVGDPADAADLVAETFVVAWRRLDDVPPGDGARLWMFGVARRILGNHRRGELRRSKLADRLRNRLVDLVVADASAVADTAHVVGLAMAHLDEADQEILRLISWEGLTPAEVAVVLAVPDGTARSRRGTANDPLAPDM